MGPYYLDVLTEILIFTLFAAGLQFLTGVAGMISFGHAAYLGLGAYGAALAGHHLGLPMEVGLLAAPLAAGAGAALFGPLCARLSGVYLAMLTLAFAEVLHAGTMQWYSVTGGDNGLLGLWPSAWATEPAAYYGLTLVLTAGALILLRRLAFAPFGLGLRAIRDSRRRADAVGLPGGRLQWAAFAVGGAVSGLGGGLLVYLKGSVFPEVLGVGMSVDALVMMLLGGIHSLSGPAAGAALFKAMEIGLASWTDQWRMIVGAVIVLIVVLLPGGLAGLAESVKARRGRRGEGGH